MARSLVGRRDASEAPTIVPSIAGRSLACGDRRVVSPIRS